MMNHMSFSCRAIWVFAVGVSFMCKTSLAEPNWVPSGLLEPPSSLFSALEQSLDYACFLRRQICWEDVQESRCGAPSTCLSMTVMPSLGAERIVTVEEVSLPGSAVEYRVRYVQLTRNAWDCLREYRSKRPRPFVSYPQIEVDRSEATLPGRSMLT